uniref:G_PROTEIN_RECEP_F1_2 domain-containing protein n=1 Tax=Schistosoma mansoni TaxID=6183 RepID=A0A5K4F5R2_SCHMA
MIFIEKETYNNYSSINDGYVMNPILIINNQKLSDYVTANNLESTSWTLWLGITVVLLTMIITWILHISIMISVCRNMIMKHTTYYYIISIGFVVMLHSLLNFPVNIISDLIEVFSIQIQKYHRQQFIISRDT